MRRLWVEWAGSTRAHLADAMVTGSDIRSGDFPVLCGSWAPSGLDTEVTRQYTKLYCQRCVKAQQRKEQAEAS